MQNYSKTAAGNYSFAIDRPSGVDPQRPLAFSNHLSAADFTLGSQSQDIKLKIAHTAKERLNLPVSKPYLIIFKAYVIFIE
jgi:hypothetical protein